MLNLMSRDEFVVIDNSYGLGSGSWEQQKPVDKRYFPYIQ